MLLSVKFPIGASDDQATFPNLTGFLYKKSIKWHDWWSCVFFVIILYLVKKKGLSYKLINCNFRLGSAACNTHFSWNRYLFVSWWLVLDRQPNVDQQFTDNQLIVDWGSSLFFQWVDKSITGNHKKEIFQCHGNMCKLKWESGVLNLLSP